MYDVRTTTNRRPPARVGLRRPLLRWAVTFAGFPLGAVAARIVAGPIDTTTAAVIGGLTTGAVLGAAQAWALRPDGPAAVRWIAATALGLMVGLAIGTRVVGFDTDVAALVTQGAICGLAVGAAQAVVLRPLLGRVALAWPLALGALWALGWAITAGVGVKVGEQFTVFGSSGAITVTALTAVLPLAIARRAGGAS